MEANKNMLIDYFRNVFDATKGAKNVTESRKLADVRFQKCSELIRCAGITYQKCHSIKKPCS